LENYEDRLEELITLVQLTISTRCSKFISCWYDYRCHTSWTLFFRK